MWFECPSSMSSVLLRLAAHTPLTADEGALARRRQVRRARITTWVLAPAIFLAALAAASVGLYHLLPGYHLLFVAVASIVWGCCLAYALLGVACWLSIRHEPDYAPLSSYWLAELAKSTARFPEIDAVRVEWLRSCPALSGVEFRLLTEAVGEAHVLLRQEIPKTDQPAPTSALASAASAPNSHEEIVMPDVLAGLPQTCEVLAASAKRLRLGVEGHANASLLEQLVPRIIAMHNALVCQHALDMADDSGFSILERFGWDRERSNEESAATFVAHMRERALSLFEGPEAQLTE